MRLGCSRFVTCVNYLHLRETRKRRYKGAKEEGSGGKGSNRGTKLVHVTLYLSNVDGYSLIMTVLFMYCRVLLFLDFLV